MLVVCPAGFEKPGAERSSALGGEPCEAPGAGKIHIVPSVRTPSTSKMISLILRARAAGEGLGMSEILAFAVSRFGVRAPWLRRGSPHPCNSPAGSE